MQNSNMESSGQCLTPSQYALGVYFTSNILFSLKFWRQGAEYLRSDLSQALSMMVGMVVNDGKSPVELFQKDDPGQFVGQSHGAQAES